jgi:hypothetical protein
MDHYMLGYRTPLLGVVWMVTGVVVAAIFASVLVTPQKKRAGVSFKLLVS